MFSSWVAKWINQLAHIGWGIVIASFASEMLNPWWGLLIITGFAAVKEFVFDKLTASGPSQFTDTQDFGYWMVGGAIGIGLSLIVRHRLL
jgi:hypothetical protein